MMPEMASYIQNVVIYHFRLDVFLWLLRRDAGNLFVSLLSFL